MILDRKLRTLWLRGRAERELYIKDVARDRGISLEEAEVFIDATHEEVPLIGEPRSGMQYQMERKVWFA